MEDMKPHVAFLPSPGMGNTIPLFELAKRLVVHHGFCVSFLAITTEALAAQNQLLQSPSLPPDLTIINIPPADMSNILVDDHMLLLTRLCLIIEESLKPLRSILLQLGRRPRALIIDIFCTEAFEVCEELAIPVYSFFTASTALLAFSLYLPTLDQEVEGEFVDLHEPIQAPGCKTIRNEDLLDQVKNRKKDEYKWYLFHVSRLRLAVGIFVNTWDDLEAVSLQALKENPFYRSINTPPIYTIGPLMKDDENFAEKDAEILSWLNNQPHESVLFIALGSGGTLSGEQLIELACGLEMSQQRFILVVRRPSEASASAAFFGTGSDESADPRAYLPQEFLKKTKEMGLVVPSWAPQVAILRHPSTGAFLSHCGWNSTLESVVHGVPMIAWPLYAEQKMNATMLEEEIGVAVKPVVVPGDEVIGMKEIERVVRLVMESEEGKAMRQRARALKESAIKALNCGGSSFDALNMAIEFLKSQNL